MNYFYYLFLGSKRREGHVSVFSLTLYFSGVICQISSNAVSLLFRTALARFRQAQLEEGKIKVRLYHLNTDVMIESISDLHLII